MPVDAFENFIYAFGAARLLLSRAHDQGFLIEGMALYASLLDGFLRIALVLKRQLKAKSSAIDDTLIQQRKGGTFYSERQVYRMAFQEGVIDEATYQALGRLYDRRNDIIHKFFLTPITYQSLPDDLLQYEQLFNALYAIVYALEKEQIELGVGMTTTGSADRNAEFFERVNDKIAPKSAPHPT
jgi:hypothetical protein